MRRWSVLVLLALLPTSISGADACDGGFAAEHGARIESRDHVVVFRTQPRQIAVGQFFSVEALVCSRHPGAAPSTLRVDALMPEHKHGMNYRATVSTRGDGRHVAEGLLFHMPGRWRLVFDVAADGRTERLVSDLVLE